MLREELNEGLTALLDFYLLQSLLLLSKLEPDKNDEDHAHDLRVSVKHRDRLRAPLNVLRRLVHSNAAREQSREVGQEKLG